MWKALRPRAGKGVWSVLRPRPLQAGPLLGPGWAQRLRSSRAVCHLQPFLYVVWGEGRDPREDTGACSLSLSLSPQSNDTEQRILSSRANRGKKFQKST